MRRLLAGILRMWAAWAERYAARVTDPAIRRALTDAVAIARSAAHEITDPPQSSSGSEPG